jgi:hypothetical protein
MISHLTTFDEQVRFHHTSNLLQLTLTNMPFSTQVSRRKLLQEQGYSRGDQETCCSQGMHFDANRACLGCVPGNDCYSWYDQGAPFGGELGI